MQIETGDITPMISTPIDSKMLPSILGGEKRAMLGFVWDFGLVLMGRVCKLYRNVNRKSWISNLSVSISPFLSFVKLKKGK